MANYRVNIEADDNGTLLVTSPDLPEVTTFGENREEALRAAVGAVSEALAGRMARDEDIPAWANFVRVGSDSVLLDDVVALKVSLQRAMKGRGYTRARLAREMKRHRNSVDRLFDLDHASKLEQLGLAFHALGYGLDMRLYRLEDEAALVQAGRVRAEGDGVRVA